MASLRYPPIPQVQDNGTAEPSEPILNFTGGITVADDPTNNRLNVSGAGAGPQAAQGGDLVTVVQANVLGTSGRFAQADHSHARQQTSLSVAGGPGSTSLTSGNHTVFCNPNAGTLTLDLPAGASLLEFVVMHTGTVNTVVIDPNGAETVNGLATLTLVPGQAVVIRWPSAGSGWSVAAGYGLVSPQFQVDATRALSDPTTLFSYHYLAEGAGLRFDVMNRIPLTDNGPVDSVVMGGPSTQEILVADFPNNAANYLSNVSTSNWWATTTPFSGSCWFRLDTLPGAGGFMALVSRIQSDGGGGWIVCVAESGGNVNLNIRFLDGVSVDALSQSTNLAINTWYHAAWAWDGTNRYLWINGANQATDVPARTPSVSDAQTAFMVGRINSAGTPLPLDGRMCHLAQWRNYTLTTARALELYNSGTPNRLRY